MEKKNNKNNSTKKKTVLDDQGDSHQMEFVISLEVFQVFLPGKKLKIK